MTLVREQRQDKNGNVVTRWVKPAQAAGTVANLPPVSLPVELPFDRVDYIVELLNHWGEHGIEDFDEQNITNKFWELDNLTLLAIDVDYALDSGSGERMPLIYDWVGYFAEEHEEYLRELVTYAGAFTDHTSAMFIEKSISLLKRSGDLPPMEDYSQASPELQQTIRNILSVTEAVFASDHDERNGAGVQPELPTALCSLIMQRPDDTDRIKEIVTSRKTTDADLIQFILDTDAPAVSGGIL